MPRYFVMHDYGMGALYWWIDAPSADDIIRTYAEVVVLDDAAAARHDNIPIVAIDDETHPPGLDGLRDRRAGQIGHPQFGALIGRGAIYLRRPDPEEESIYCFEYGPQGYCTRRVVIDAKGDAVRTVPDDWWFNPPEDLWNPELAQYEITRDEFDRIWETAHPPTDGPDW